MEPPLTRLLARTVATALAVGLAAAAATAWVAWLGNDPVDGVGICFLSGIGFAALLLLDPREWLVAAAALGTGAFVVERADGTSVAIAAGLALGAMVAAASAAGLARGVSNGRFGLTQLQDLRTLLLCATVGALAGATVLGAALVIEGATDDLWSTLGRRALAEALGMLVIVPVVVSWPSLARSRRRTRPAELAAWTIAIGAATYAALGHWNEPLAFSVTLLLVGMAIRLRVRGVAWGALVAVCVADWAAARGTGPFAAAGASAASRSLVLQAFVGVVLLGLLALALALDERDAAIGERWVATERFRRAFDTSPIGIAVATLDGVLLEVNPALCDLLSVSERELVGSSLRSRLPDDTEAHDADRGWPTGSEVQDSRERQLIDGHGAIAHVEIHEARLRELEGRPERKLVLVHDVTERTGLQRQLVHAQKMEAVGRLAGGIAHDFNNVLAVMRGQTELLQDDLAIIDRARARVESMQRATQRAASLTGDLMSFSRRRTDTPEAIDLNEVVRSLHELLRQVVGTAVALELRLQAEHAVIRADPNRIDQAVLNLVVNARDAMPTGGCITISTRSGPQRGRAVVTLTVADTGTGMDDDTRKQIFEPFFTTKPEGAGTGLGLSTTSDIVKATGGTITVESAPGQGTTFVLTFPSVAPSPSPPPVPPAAGDRPAPATILVVDDDDDVRGLMTEVLRGRGYDVLTACDGAAALELLDRTEPSVDLLLTDVVMPRIDGPELAARLTARSPHTGVLFVSGDTEVDRDRRALRGAPLLTKPLDRAALLVAVQDALTRSPYSDA